MEWFEYIFIVVAISLVLLPIILKIIGKKRGKPACSSCCCCPHKNCCQKAIDKVNE